MQIKAKMRYTTYQSEWLKPGTLTTPVLRGRAATGTLLHCWWGCRTVRWKSFVVFYKTKRTMWFSNHAPSYFTQMSWKHKNLAALLVIPKTWRPPRRPLVGEWINKLWYLKTVQYYSVLKGNVLSSHEKIWRKLKVILLTKEANLKRLHMVWFQLCDILAKAKYMKTD